MEGKRPGVLSLVLVPALLTLGITVLRLVGELKGWSPLWFGQAEAGGGGALLGISWLIFVFGFYFGIRLQRGGAGKERPAKALLWSLFGPVVLFGGFAACQAADLIWVPDAEHPGEMRGLVYFLALMAIGVLIAMLAWWRASVVLLVYAVCARVPVLVVTWLAVENHWETHYIKTAPGMTRPPEAELFTFLSMPQITFWPAITVILGTVMACLGALLAGRPKAA